MHDDDFLPGPSTVPFGSAYGLDNVAAQVALRLATVVVLDESFIAFADAHFDWTIQSITEEHTHAPTREALSRLASEPDASSVTHRLPQIYRDRYLTYDFLKKWIATLSIVGWKLAQPTRLPLTNLAEELALHAYILDARAILELAEGTDEAARSLSDLEEEAFEDQDFLVLFELEYPDDLPDVDPERVLGVTDLRFKHWFTPFGNGTDRGVPLPLLVDF